MWASNDEIHRKIQSWNVLTLVILWQNKLQLLEAILFVTIKYEVTPKLPNYKPRIVEQSS